MPIQTVHSVQFLTVVFISLNIAIRAAPHQCTCRVVIIDLLDSTAFAHNDTVVT